MIITLKMILEMRRTILLNLEDGLLTIFRIHYHWMIGEQAKEFLI